MPLQFTLLLMPHHYLPPPLLHPVLLQPPHLHVAPHSLPFASAALAEPGRRLLRE